MAGKKRKGVFTNELSAMVYGFGGDASPDPQTLSVLEDALIEFVGDLVKRAGAAASKPGKLRVQDLLYIIRNNPKQWGRAKELLLLRKEIEAAKRTSTVAIDHADDTLTRYAAEGSETPGPPEDPLDSGDETVA